MVLVSENIGVASANRLRELSAPYGFVCAVVDKNVSAFARNLLMEDTPIFEIEACEEKKTMSGVMDICRFLMGLHAGRDTLLISVGGGITSDIAGFASSVYGRGIAFGAVPTTLLAMVDAAIGGKTGVNLDGCKNMVGSFHSAEFVMLVKGALDTLPEREYLCGVSELLKTFLVSDESSYRECVRRIVSSESIDDMILKAARTKLSIVSSDPFDKGYRHVLNLGHTYAHAIERYGLDNPEARKFSHGEAVAIGTICAALLSERLGYASKGLAGRLEMDFESIGLPVYRPEYIPDRDTLARYFRNDKKSVGLGGSIDFVFPTREGEVKVARTKVEDCIL